MVYSAAATCVILLTLLLVAGLPSLVSSFKLWPGNIDCSPCDCHIQRLAELHLAAARVANCTNLQLTSIPSYFPPDIDHLDLTGNNIRDLNGSELDQYNNLKALILAGNGMTTLPRSLFQNTTLLQYLDLTGVELEQLSGEIFENLEFFTVLKGIKVTQFPDGIFSQLSQLRSLEFRTTRDQLPKGLLEGLSLHTLSLYLDRARSLPRQLLQSGQITLQEVNIVGPELRALDAELFDNLTLLRRVSIDAEAIWTLPEHFLHGTQVGTGASQTIPQGSMTDDAYQQLLAVLTNNRLSLKEVSISGVSRIPEKLFQNLPNLESLSLQRAYNIPAAIFVPTLARLDMLDLSENAFTLVNEGWFQNLQGLKALNLSHNKLQAINESDLSKLYSLESLDLSHNQLSQMHAESFRSFRSTLKYLDVGHNQVCHFSQELFMEMWALEVLKLNDNGCFSHVPANLFQGLEYLIELHLQGNSIETLAPSLFIGQPDLAFLNISHNMLRSLPNNLLAHSTLLRVLDMSNNDIGVLPDHLLDRKDQSLLEVVLADGNPLSCDCGVVQLLWLAQTPDVSVQATCSSPATLNGTEVSSVPVSVTCQHQGFLSQFDDLLETPAFIEKDPEVKGYGNMSVEQTLPDNDSSGSSIVNSTDASANQTLPGDYSSDISVVSTTDALAGEQTLPDADGSDSSIAKSTDASVDQILPDVSLGRSIVNTTDAAVDQTLPEDDGSGGSAVNTTDASGDQTWPEDNSSDRSVVYTADASATDRTLPEDDSFGSKIINSTDASAVEQTLPDADGSDSSSGNSTDGSVDQILPEDDSSGRSVVTTTDATVDQTLPEGDSSGRRVVTTTDATVDQALPEDDSSGRSVVTTTDATVDQALPDVDGSGRSVVNTTDATVDQTLPEDDSSGRSVVTTMNATVDQALPDVDGSGRSVVNTTDAVVDHTLPDDCSGESDVNGDASVDQALPKDSCGGNVANSDTSGDWAGTPEDSYDNRNASGDQAGTPEDNSDDRDASGDQAKASDDSFDGSAVNNYPSGDQTLSGADSSGSIVENSAWFQGFLGSIACAGMMLGTAVIIKVIRRRCHHRSYTVNQV